MKLFPAIDIRDGKVVRLLRGDFAAETVYGEDPVEVAQAFEAQGAEWIHVVDLDAARSGIAKNRLVIGAIASAVSIPVQAGGGVRDEDSAQALLDAGVARAVLGTVAVEAPELVEWLAGRHPGRIAVGLDGRNGEVAVHGWVQGGSARMDDLIRRFSQHPVAAFIVTNIDRDGTLEGPDIEGIWKVVESTDVDVLASGGIGSLDHLRALAAIRPAGHKRVAGTIVGKALYENRFTLPEALTACSDFSESEGS